VVFEDFNNQKTNSTKMYDLANLPDGNYIIELVSGKERATRPIQLFTQTTRFASAN
jgi:hypothetical protein